MSDVVVRGTDVTAQQRRAEAQGGFAALYAQDFADYEVRGAVNVSDAARGAATEVPLDGDPSDVVEIEGVDGSVRFRRAGGLLDDRGAGTRDITAALVSETRATGVAQVSRVRAVLPAAVAGAVEELDQRLSWVDRNPLGQSLSGMAIDVLAPVLIDPAARRAARTLAQWMENPATAADPPAVRRKRPKLAGVYRIGTELLVEPDHRLGSGHGLSGDDPWLLLMHGTFSHTEAAFGALRNTPEWIALADRYGDRMLALEHPTLSLTPAENALAAVRDLPGGARLHVVSHSRGGLIGDVLSLAHGRMPDLSAFPDAHPDRAVLHALNRELGEREIVITRFARVASPARGTTLASRRLDAWASVLFNFVKFVPVLRESGMAELIRKFVLAVLEKRTDPRVMPGVEAMMPESACVRLLNTAEPRDTSDGLASLTGDIEGSGIARRVLVGMADLFYGGANDLVVDTSSMTLGLPRADERVARFRGGDVNHASYFANAPSRAALQRWLVGDTADVRGFVKVDRDDPTDHGGTRGATAATADATGGVGATVLLVPDALGCVITEKDRDGTQRELWPNVRALTRRGPAEVLRTEGCGEATRLLRAYEGMVAGLSAAGTVRPVLWDARRPLAEAAIAFRDALTAALRGGEPVHVVVHGAGALVVEAARDSDADHDWARVRERGGTCLLLSPPLDGSWSTVARTEGRDALTTMLALLSPSTDRDELIHSLAGLPGLAVQRPDVERAEREPSWWAGVVALYGAPIRTPCGRGENDELLACDAGDGNVPYPAGPRPGLKRRYATVSTWTLLINSDIATGLGELLAGRGSPWFLSAPPSVPTATQAWPSSDGRLLFPTVEDLSRAALHGSAVPKPAQPQLHVSVVHGDIRHVPKPLMIGSFDGTPIAGAEGVLDSMLDGALTRRQTLGQHPGPAGTMGVFYHADGTPAAVVIGIGDPGDITPSRLSTGVTQAVLRLAAARLDTSGGHDEQLDLATVLIGTSGTAPLSVQSSVTAIVNGVRRANRRLRGLQRPITVDALQIVELYEERAADAARALALLLDKPDAAGQMDRTSETLTGETQVITGTDGRTGQPRREDRQDEWSTIRVGRSESRGTADAQEGLAALSFTRLGRGAGADQQITTTQRRLVDRLMARSVGSPQVDPQLYNTLYELLLPPSMKGQGRERDNIMYVVDEHASVLPLELLGTRSYDSTVQPMAVDVGVIRRLETRRSRANPRVAPGTSALVIGNPPSRYANLPGAAEEAHRVAEQLRGYGYRVTELIAQGPDDRDMVNAEKIVNALFGQEHRILHIAGHGVYDAERPASSGVVIDDDLYLTALEIQQMQAVPEMVFLNCCHLSTLQRPLSVVRRNGGDPQVAEVDGSWRPDHTAASISGALIDGGVRAVVAAGWAVDDRAAAAFAVQLYQHLLDGTDLGHATLWARKHVYGGEFEGTNTWGAYQVYGPPAFKLTTAGVRASGRSAPVSRREFRDELESLLADARKSTDTAAIDSALQHLLDHAGPDWVSGEEHGLIGAIRAELGQYREAIDEYESALSRWGANARLKAIEQLANIEFKAAAQGILDPVCALPAPRTPDELFERAENRIRNLIELADATPERLSVFGSYWRRRAQADAARSGDVGAAAAESAIKYREADEMSKDKRGVTNFYAAINYAVMEWIAAQHGRGKLADTAALLSIIDDAEQAARDPAHTDFWARVTPADAQLARHLLRGTLVDYNSETEVAAKYEIAFGGGSSARERLAITEHLVILRDLTPDDNAHAATRTVLEKLALRLASWAPAE